MGYKYPIYPNVENGDTMYNDITLYLINRNNNNYRSLYHKYINENEFSDNEKRYFRNRAKNFYVNENGDLMIKRYNKKKKVIEINILHYFMFCFIYIKFI